MGEEPKCGTRYKYLKYDCRCELCLEAVREFNHKKNEKKKNRPRFPVEPIIERMNEYHRRAHEHLVRTGAGKTLAVYQADRLCCEIGLHPYEVYGDAWYEDIWEQMATEGKSRWETN